MPAEREDVVRILGIDPGSRVTGYGVIAKDGPELGYITCGTIRTGEMSDFSSRLFAIFEGISRVIETHAPDIAAVEDLFVARNPRSALKLGQARGAAVVAVMHHRLTVHSYTPRVVKQTVTGYGQAEKAQVQEMVRLLLHLNGHPSSDAADGLALALCHASHMDTMSMTTQVRSQ